MSNLASTLHINITKLIQVKERFWFNKKYFYFCLLVDPACSKMSLIICEGFSFASSPLYTCTLHYVHLFKDKKMNSNLVLLLNFTVCATLFKCLERDWAHVWNSTFWMVSKWVVTLAVCYCFDSHGKMFSCFTVCVERVNLFVFGMCLIFDNKILVLDCFS